MALVCLTMIRYNLLCREHGIGIVPYSPIGRGFLVVGPKLAENLIEGNFKKDGENDMALPRWMRGGS
ncbi:hypothetical protein L6452_18229 [Arctium lappa]|uniref:Uncharacterized protein n=1 Tax=Arctium lappa TaxID=4217 RepID=A0ACB9C5R7_ARCLA|nr:hypothetical protein L6452_18229 [Arctium lappa]